MLSFTGLQQFGAAANNIPSLLSMTSGPMPLMATNQFGNNGNGMNGNMNNGGRKSFGGGGGGGGGGRFSNYSSKGAFFKQNRQQGGHQQYQHQQQNQQQQQQQQQQQSRADKSVLCETCNIRLNSQQIYESHCKGAKHLKRLAQINAVLPHLPENAGQSTEVSSSSTGATTTITTTTTSIVAAQSELKIETSLPAVKFDEDICAVSPVGDENQQPMETENNIANNTNSEQTPIKTEGTTTNQNETATSQVKSNNPNRRPNTYNYNKMVKRAAEKVVRVMHKCDVCNVGGMTDVSYLAHLSGKMHARKLKMNGGNNNNINTTPVSQTNTTTTTTNITPTIEAINLSSDGESVQAVSCDEGPSNTEQQSTAAATSSDPSNIVQYRCDMCDVNLSSDAQLELHVSGVKHQKKIAQINKNKTANNAKIGGGGEIPMTTSTKTTPIKSEPKSEPVEYNCEICNIKLVSQQQLDIHLGGKKHKKKLASSSVIGPSVALADNKKNKEDDEKYAHLNIAWDKYRIVDTQSIPEAMRGKYEFYCVLCNKYMQKKPQLVDHLKCKRHHQKIYEKRQRDAGVLNPTAGSTTTTTTTGTKPMTNAGLNRPTAKSFRGGKVGGQTPRFNANKKINFVPGSSAGNKTSFMSYSTQSNNQMNSTGALSNNTQPSMSTLLSYPMSSFFGNSNKQSLQQELPGGGMKRKNVNGPQYDAMSNMNKMPRMDNANQQNFAAAATQQQTSLVGANYGYGYGYDSFASFFSQQFNSNN